MKPRRDITLGEMQDECKKRERTCNTEPRCPYLDYCPFQTDDSPRRWNLTDPPRFTEQQMAFFRWWSERGAVKAVAMNNFEYGAVVVFEDANERQLGNVQEISILAAIKENGNALDLAELLGKDGESK